MTDHELEERLRAWYRSEIPADEVAPADLRSSLAAITRAPSARLRRFRSGRGLALLAAAALLGVLGGTAGIGRFLDSRPEPIPAIWSITGRTTDAHYAHTATLLLDGRVLIAGGDGDIPTDSTELYDSATGSWNATDRMNQGRSMHTATLLPDGRVLVAGGVGVDLGAQSSAELFDAATGTWTITGTMLHARHGHTATLLPDGRVLVAGGATDAGHSAAAELYDPETGTWISTDGLLSARAFHTATLLPDGTVLVAGSSDEAVARSAELYDPRLGTWTASGSMTHGRMNFTATLLPGGVVLAAGGAGDASSEIYDPRSGTWSATGSMLSGRFGNHAAVLLPDGTVLVTGGHSGTLDVGLQELSAAEIYDSARRTWTATAPMGTARRWHTATVLPVGTVLVVGGASGDDTSQSAELYGAPDGQGQHP